MRAVRGVPKRDLVISRKGGVASKPVKAGEIKTTLIDKHREDADTAKAELAKLKEKLGILGLDIDNLPDALPGANTGNESAGSGAEAGAETGADQSAGADKSEKAGKKAGK